MDWKAVREEVTFELVLVAEDEHFKPCQHQGTSSQLEMNRKSLDNGTGLEEAGNGGAGSRPWRGLEEHVEVLGYR